MKVYELFYISSGDVAIIEVFTSKAKFNKRPSDIKRNQEAKQIFDSEALDFESGTEGLITALECCAEMVFK